METQDQKPSGTNAKKTNSSNSSKLIERIKLKEEPFEIVKVEGGSYLMFGSYAIAKDVETQEEATEFLNKKKWSIITTLIGICYEKLGGNNGN